MIKRVGTKTVVKQLYYSWLNNCGLCNSSSPYNPSSLPEVLVLSLVSCATPDAKDFLRRVGSVACKDFLSTHLHTLMCISNEIFLNSQEVLKFQLCIMLHYPSYIVNLLVLHYSRASQRRQEGDIYIPS